MHLFSTSFTKSQDDHTSRYWRGKKKKKKVAIMQSRYRKAASLSLFFLNSKSYMTLLRLSCSSPVQVTLVSSCTSKGRRAALLLPGLSTSRRLVSSTLLLPLPKAGTLCSSALPEALSTQTPEDLVSRWRKATRETDWCNPSPSHQGTRSSSFPCQRSC